MNRYHACLAFTWVLTSALATRAPAAAPIADVPRYAHIFVIIAENKNYAQIIGPASRAPHINRLAHQYGLASRFYAEVHPSEGNYVAMLGGDTFGIHDDDAFYCKAGLRDPFCPSASQPDYPDHTVTARSLMDQLAEHGLSWKAYLESLPEPGSLAVRWPTADQPVAGVAPEIYAVKHNGFLSFLPVQQDPQRAAKIVDFEQLHRDLAAGNMPNYAHIVPNQCNDMHGRGSDPNTPADCLKSNPEALIARGDRVISELVQSIMQSSSWRAPENSAIVITFDENDRSEREGEDQGCCGYEPESAANFGGGRIPTVVITNHGPRHLQDPTPYNHYSLLRTTEAAFGIGEYLGHAAETGKGVTVMAPLFAAKP